MNALQGVLVAVAIGVVGIGPFIAVHIGGKAFDDDDDDDDDNDNETQHDEPDKVTVKTPRVTGKHRC